MPEEVRRALLNLPGTPTSARVDILRSGRVRLRLAGPGGVQDWQEETLEDMMLLAATLPDLPGGLYDALMWELDLMGLRGDRARGPVPPSRQAP